MFNVWYTDHVCQFCQNPTKTVGDLTKVWRNGQTANHVYNKLHWLASSRAKSQWNTNTNSYTATEETVRAGVSITGRTWWIVWSEWLASCWTYSMPAINNGPELQCYFIPSSLQGRLWLAASRWGFSVSLMHSPYFTWTLPPCSWWAPGDVFFFFSYACHVP